MESSQAPQPPRPPLSETQLHATTRAAWFAQIDDAVAQAAANLDQQRADSAAAMNAKYAQPPGHNGETAPDSGQPPA